MRRERFIWLRCGAGLAAAGLAVGAIAAPASSAMSKAEPVTLSSRGLGVFRLGMSEAQVRATHVRRLGPAEGPSDSTCRAVRTEDDVAPALTLIFFTGRLSMIDVDQPGLSTRSGVTIGTPLARLKALFGAQLEFRPVGVDGNVDPDSTNAFLWETDHRYGVRFFISGNQVQGMTAGDDALLWPEGCDG